MYSSDPYMYITRWWQLHPDKNEPDFKKIHNNNNMILQFSDTFQYFNKDLSCSVDRKLRFYNMSFS